MNSLQKFEKRQQDALMAGRPSIPVFTPGDTLIVHVRVREGERERIQRFEGVCIARRNAALHSSFTVRRVTNGFGLERLFPLYSPIIDHIEVVRRGRVRRAKLYYLRELTGKKARIRERPRKSTSEKKVSSSEQPSA